MRAEIIAVGTEVLLGEIVDSHSQTLAQVFTKHAIVHERRGGVIDNIPICAEMIRESLARCDALFLIGGLGPTTDDLTREAICSATKLDLVLDDAILAHLQELVRLRGREWNRLIEKMAMLPAGASAIPNPAGSAPGIFLPIGDKVIIALPGPPSEFRAVLESEVLTDWFASKTVGSFETKTFRLAGAMESKVELRLGDLILGENPTVATYVKPGEVQIRVAARGKSLAEVRAIMQPAVERVREMFAASIFSENGEPLEAVVVETMRHFKVSLATAESCTGGMLGSRITSVPGSSDIFLGGFVTYSNDMKARQLGVARTDIQEFGAVSETVARQMAEGVKRIMQSDYAIGITGVAGPSESDKKPAGLVFIGLSGPRGTEVAEHHFRGDREMVRFLSTQEALEMLRKELHLS